MPRHHQIARAHVLPGGGSRGVDPSNSLQSSSFWEVPRHHQIARAHILPGGSRGVDPSNSLQSTGFWEVPRHHQIARAHVLPGGGPGGLTLQIPCKVAVFGRCPDITKLHAHMYCRGGSRGVDASNVLQSSSFWEVPRHHQIACAHVLPGGGPGGLTPHIPCKVAVFGRCPDIARLRACAFQISSFW